MNLKNYYPNYVHAINLMKDRTDLTQCKNSRDVLSHGMSYNVYGNKLGDIYIDLNKNEDFVYITFATYKGLSEKARTYGHKIYKDLEVQEWVEAISEIMNTHNANPDHAQLVIDFTRKKVTGGPTTSVKSSGCMVTLLFLFIPVVFYFLH